MVFLYKKCNISSSLKPSHLFAPKVELAQLYFCNKKKGIIVLKVNGGHGMSQVNGLAAAENNPLLELLDLDLSAPQQTTAPTTQGITW